MFTAQPSPTLQAMALTRRAPSFALLFALCVCTGGCGGRDGVDPKAWARSVCNALSPWRTEISDLTAKAQEKLGAATTAGQAKANVVALLAGAEESSEKARRGVAGAGVPAVDGGDQIAKHFAASLEKARDAYGHAKTTVSALSTQDSKSFYANVKTAFATLNDEYAKSALDTEHVGSKDLQRAFDEVPECR
jgi:hypothetical protein